MNSGPDHRLSRLLAPLLVPLLLLCFCCRSLSPEERVRRTLAEAAESARDGNLASLERTISERYRDRLGNGKREALALLRFQLGRPGSVHLLEHVRSIRQTGPARVEARVLVAAAAVPIHDLRELDRVTADLLLFDIGFEREAGNRWRAVDASWRRAGPGDLF